MPNFTTHEIHFFTGEMIWNQSLSDWSLALPHYPAFEAAVGHVYLAHFTNQLRSQ
jgi:hypothetical protein